MDAAYLGRHDLLHNIFYNIENPLEIVLAYLDVKNSNSSEIEQYLYEYGIIHPPLYTSFKPSEVVIAVQSLSHVRVFAISWTAACQASLSFISPRLYSNSCTLSR